MAVPTSCPDDSRGLLLCPACFCCMRKVDVTLADQIEFACLMEATARKPGNVHPAAAFDDLRYEDFVRAAQAISQPLSMVREIGLGNAIFEAVRCTRSATGTNVNLGIILLLAPLAAVPGHVPLDEGVQAILSGTTTVDAERVYTAISLAQPGGLGKAAAQDIHEHPTVTLLEAMRLAVARDRIAEQYVEGYRLVFEARTQLCKLLSRLGDWEAAVIWLHVWIMSRWPDTLIARKCGRELAEEASVRARGVMDRATDVARFERWQLEEFDTWLRSDGHRRNPGTTADLIAATLFAAIRDGLIDVPTRDEICLRARSIVLLT